jgi:hypothetical protein
MSVSNPQIAQGVLNRARASVVFANNPQLNVTSPFLGAEGINLTLDGAITDNIETMTGTVTSPALYQMATVELDLLKSQSFSDVFKQFLENLAITGPFTVIPDSPTLSNYPILNGNIMSAGPGRMNGKAVQFLVALRGYYNINSALFGLS